MKNLSNRNIESIKELLDILNTFRKEPNYFTSCDDVNDDVVLREELMDALVDSHFHIVDWMRVMQMTFTTQLQCCSKEGEPTGVYLKTMMEMSLFLSRLLYCKEAIFNMCDEAYSLRKTLERINELDEKEVA